VGLQTNQLIDSFHETQFNMAGRGLKIVGGALVLTGGYYLYKQQYTGKRADVLAKQDFSRIVQATENKKNEGRFNAEEAGRKLDEKYEKSKRELETKFDNARDSVSKEAKRAGDETKDAIDRAGNQSKGVVDKVTGWFK
jgi:hypothetical protein